MLIRMCRKTHAPKKKKKKKGPGNIHTRGSMVHENTKNLTFSDACVLQCVCTCTYHYKNVLPMQYTKIFLALIIEEKIYLIVYTLEPPRVKIKKQKEVTLYAPFYPVYLTTLKVGFNGIYVKANVHLSCKLTLI